MTADEVLELGLEKICGEIYMPVLARGVCVICHNGDRTQQQKTWIPYAVPRVSRARSCALDVSFFPLSRSSLYCFDLFRIKRRSVHRPPAFVLR